MIYLKDGNIPLNLAYDDDIVQEANSTYQLSFKFPLTDKKWKELKKEVFILADDLHGEQEFFILEAKKANGYVQVYAKQVATLLNYYSVDSISVDRVPGQTVMTALASSTKRTCPFTFFSDILDRHTFNESDVSVMDALVKDKHSILGQWGGDLVRDKYQVKLLKNGGIENESLFMYKKNLSSYEESENINNLKTRLHLKKTIQGQSEGEADRVIAVTVDSPLINQYSQIYEADVEVNDQDVTDEASLLVYGQKYFSSTLCDLVENSINLDVKGKSDVAVNMFDTVSVFHERFDVDLRLKITSYHFAPISKRLKSIGFGKVSQSFGSVVASVVAGSVDKATKSFEQKLQKEIDNANQYFDAEFEKQKIAIEDGIEQAKAEAELYADTIKQNIDADVNAINQSMQAQSEEHDRQVADILSNAQSIETLANQAKTDAANAMARANQVKTEAIADARAQVATVSQALNTAKTDLQNQVSAADSKAVKAQADVDGLKVKAETIKNDLNTAKTDLQNKVNGIDAKAQTLTEDLANSKNDILAQATAQSALKNRVTTVETTANGTKETVTQLSKTVNDLNGEVSSATQSIKTVEDSIDGVYTTLSKIQVGGANLLNRTRDLFYNSNKTNNTSETYQGFTVASGVSTGTGYVDIFGQTMNTVADKTDYFVTFYAKGAVDGQTIDCHFFNPASTTRAESNQGAVTTVADGKITITLTTTWQRYWIKWTQTAGTTAKKVLIGRNASTNRAYVAMPALFEGNTIRDWSGSLQDSSMEFAEYKQAIDGQLTSLSNSYQTLDGKVAQNTARIKTTADSIREDVTSLQSYVDDEGTRRTEYLTASALKTAELIAVERTKTAKDYVAKSTYTEDVTTIRRDVSETKTSLNSVSSRTKAVEDGLAGVKTNYTQLNQTVNAQTGQIETINSKTADLQSGIDGVTERFDNLQVGARNYAEDYDFSRGMWEYSQGDNSTQNWNISDGIYTLTTTTNTFHQYQIHSESGGRLGGKKDSLALLDLEVGETYTLSVEVKANSGSPNFWLEVRDNGLSNYNAVVTHIGGSSNSITATSEWVRYSVTGTIKPNSDFGHRRIILGYDEIGSISFRKVELSRGTKPMDTGPAVEDTEGRVDTLRSEIAEYKRTADQNYAGLQSTVTTLDGKVTQNKTEVNQTATQLSNRLTSVEAYKDGETTRAQSYFTASKTETAKQITAERTAISANYVAKSVYDEDARGTALKLNEIKSTADTAKQNLATYQDTVDRKLTELTSSTQTLDGKINTASSKVDTVAGQIRTEISTVEAKIPTEIGGRNYILKSQAEISSTGSWVSKLFNLSSYLLSNLSKIKTVTVSCDVEGMNIGAIDNRKRYGLSWAVEINGIVNYWEVWQTEDTTKKRISQTFTVPNGKVITGLRIPALWIQASGQIKVSNPKLEFGSVPTDHTLAPEDINDELSSVKTTINQTSQGVEQLSTSLSTTDGKVTTAETKINQLIGDVSSKVSQTDYNTLTGRVSSAETAITQNATEISKRLTSTQVEQAITDKGYATVTVLNNKVEETADSFSRTISETKALIPTAIGGRNYILNSNIEIGGNGAFRSMTLSPDLLNNLSKIKAITISCDVAGTNVTSFDSKKRYGVSCNVAIDGISTYWEVWQTEDTTKKRISQTFTVPEGKKVTAFYGLAMYVQAGGDIKVSNPKLEFGSVPTDHTLALEDLATVTALHNVTDTVDSHTRTIGAVGTTGSILDNVSKVTQTANGLVTEVSGDNGLKTQVSTLAGSYAIKNLTNSGTVLNQLNLNKDGSVRIDGSLVQITGTTYIEDGVITSAKIAGLDAGKIKTGTLDAARIATNSITGSHILFDQAFFNSFMANEAYLQQLFAKSAFITSVQAVAISASQITSGILKATNGAMEIDLNNANILFNSNAAVRFNSGNNALVRAKNTHTAFVHFNDVASALDGAAGGIYAAIGVTSSGDGIDSSSSGRFSGLRAFRSAIGTNHEATLDRLELYGDDVVIKDAFDKNRGLTINPVKLNKHYNFHDLIGCLKFLARVYYHLSNAGGNWQNAEFIEAFNNDLNYYNITNILDIPSPAKGWNFR